MERIKIALSVIAGMIATWLGDVYTLILLVAAAIVLDYITGLLAAGCEHSISSVKAANGLYKKAGFLLLLFFGFFLDGAIAYFAGAALNLPIPFRLPFGLIICAWIVFTEAISVTENLARLGVKLPRFLTGWLKITQDKIGSLGGGQNREE